MTHAIDRGKSLEEIQAMGITDEYDEQWGSGFIPPDRWIELLYRGMTEDRGPHGQAH